MRNLGTVGARVHNAKSRTLQTMVSLCVRRGKQRSVDGGD
ncbi:hypothetical protein X777_12609 [Ooceraea biroi]|uniref:Uncharacterized protein n=1 Tax=Ooceraea biroi TaxID=2015173 RepID=A0A026VZY0_OOCBI|nr:hypothetical protein X777_12609 [Ooceraea biroi]